MKTNKEITYKQKLGDLIVSKGTSVIYHKNNDKYYIDSNYFPKNSIEQHDSIYYGFPVDKSDIDFNV